MKKLLDYYNLIITATFVLLALLNAKTPVELATGIVFTPLLIYFALLIVPSQKPSPRVSKKMLSDQKNNAVAPSVIKLPNFDLDRRLFLKIFASGGLSLFLFSLFTGRAEKAFFGSGPNNNSSSTKDLLDEYQITEIDDSIPTYYGYVNQDGAWFIRKEEINGSYRYIKGPSNFSASWLNRATLSYDYFSSVF